MTSTRRQAQQERHDLSLSSSDHFTQEYMLSHSVDAIDVRTIPSSSRRIGENIEDNENGMDSGR
eukprot:4153433-Ditylum_brightwellii.AAC.1